MAKVAKLKKTEQRKGNSINVPMNKTEREIIEEAAKKKGLSMAGYIRYKLFYEKEA